VSRARVEEAIEVITDELHKGGGSMAWERRAGGLYYYYSATRQGGRVVKTYHGHGVLGELAAGTLAMAKQRRAEQARALAVEKARLAPLVAAMATLDEACRLMVEATLIASGYHQKKSTWRRRRVRRLEDCAVAEATGRGRNPEPAGASPGR
jgi:hypothetical protein